MKGPLLSPQLPLQGASQPASGRPTAYLTVGTLFGTIHTLNQWGKGGPCFILWNGEMDMKSINLHWIRTNRKQVDVLSAWCNLKTEYTRLLRNRFELCGSTCMRTVFNSKHYHTAQSEVGWIRGCGGTTYITGPWVRRARCKLHTSVPPHRELALLTTTLLKSWDFPGGPVAKTSHSKCRGPRFNPWSGNGILHASNKSQLY